MALYRLIVLGIAAVAAVGFAQDFSAPVKPPDQGAVMDEQRVREIVREELAKILSRQPGPNDDPRPEPEPDPEATELAPVESDAALIERARRVALAYIDNLPNFICTRATRAFNSESGSDWRKIEEMTVQVQFVDGVESYRNLIVNGRPSGEYSGGSRGQFGTALYYLFRPEAGTVFEPAGSAVIGGRDVAVFSMEMTNRRYGITDGPRKKRRSFGYRGLTSIDKQTGHVLRLEHTERLGIPPKFPVRQASDSIDYDYVPIGGRDYLLPVRAQEFQRSSKKPYFERTETEWSGCRKFGADSDITYPNAESTVEYK